VPEIEALLKACPSEEWRSFVFLALVTGLRKGELCHLRWEDVDLKKGILKVVNRADFTTKSKRNCILGLPASAVEMLRNLYVSRDGSDYVFSSKAGSPGSTILTSASTRLSRRRKLKDAPYMTCAELLLAT